MFHLPRRPAQGGDFLLAYEVDDRAAPGLVVFVRARANLQLFGE
jgi:hypothetical protein